MGTLAERKLDFDELEYTLLAAGASGLFHSFFECRCCNYCRYCQAHESESQAFSIAEAMADSHHRLKHRNPATREAA